jgi:hypothetical protein
MMGAPNTPFALTGIFTTGYFLHNNNTPARLDNSGLAFLRYRGGLDAKWFGGLLDVRGDADFLTDQFYHRYAPADLDWSIGIGSNFEATEIMIYYKNRQALDRSGYAGYYFLSIRQYFDYRKK